MVLKSERDAETRTGYNKELEFISSAKGSHQYVLSWVIYILQGSLGSEVENRLQGDQSGRGASDERLLLETRLGERNGSISLEVKGNQADRLDLEDKEGEELRMSPKCLG